MIICHWSILHNCNMSFKTIAGRSDGVFWWFSALSEDQEKYSWIHKNSCGFNSTLDIQDIFWNIFRKKKLNYIFLSNSINFKQTLNLCSTMIKFLCKYFKILYVPELTRWRLVPSILGLGSMGNVCYSKIKFIFNGLRICFVHTVQVFGQDRILLSFMNYKTHCLTYTYRSPSHVWRYSMYS